MTKEKLERVSFLKKSLEQRGDEIADLRDRLVGLQQAKDAEKDIYESQLQQLRTEFQEMKDQLTSENNVLGRMYCYCHYGRLSKLSPFYVIFVVKERVLIGIHVVVFNMLHIVFTCSRLSECYI